MAKKPRNWLSAKLKNWDFRRSYERELAAELFLSQLEQVLNEKQVSKTELAKRMNCSLANISRAMRKTTNLTVSTMVDMSLALDFRLKIELEPMASVEVKLDAPEYPPEWVIDDDGKNPRCTAHEPKPTEPDDD